MKKHLLILSLYISTINANAQQNLSSTEMLAFGSVSVQKTVANLSVIDTTNQGSGKVWNFSTIQYSSTAPDFSVHIVSPSSTPYAASFPAANYAYKEVTGTTTNYRYFNLTSTLMERVGSYVSSVNTYSDPQVEYVFPLTLGSANYDSWASTASSSGGTYDLRAVGTGTLILPSGTFNAIMVRVNVEESFLAFDVYIWYSADNGVQLLSYIVGDGFFVSPQALVFHSLTVGVEENDFISEIKYVNPITNLLSLNFKTSESNLINYSITNSLGQVINTGTAGSFQNDEQKVSVDMSNESTGVYFLNLTASNGSAKTIKLIKN